MGKKKIILVMTLTLFIVCSSLVSATELLRHQWKLNGNMNNEINSSHHATNNGATSVSSGPFGGGYDLELDESDYIDLNIGFLPANTTITYWVKYESLNNYAYVHTFRAGSDPVVAVTAGAAGDGTLYGRSDGGNTESGLGAGTTTAGSWLFVSHRIKSANHTLEYNNVKKGLNQGTTTTYTVTESYLGTYDGVGNFADGIYEMVCIWNDFLSDEDVTTLYNSGTGTSCENLYAAAGATASYVAPTPAAGAHNNTQVTLNVSCDGGENVYLYMDENNPPTNLMLTNSTTGSFTTNVTSDGQYYYFGGCADGTGGVEGNTTVRDWVYDVTTPLITWVTPAANSSTSLSSYRINAQISDTYLDGVNFTVTNSSGHIVLTNFTDLSTTNTSLFNSTDLLDFSALSGEGTYTLEICARDSLEQSPIIEDIANFKKVDEEYYNFTLPNGNVVIREFIIKDANKNKLFASDYFLTSTDEWVDEGRHLKTTWDLENIPEGGFFEIIMQSAPGELELRTDRGVTRIIDSGRNYYWRFDDLDAAGFEVEYTDKSDTEGKIEIKVSKGDYTPNGQYWSLDPIVGGLNTICSERSLTYDGTFPTISNIEYHTVNASNVYLGDQTTLTSANLPQIEKTILNFTITDNGGISSNFSIHYTANGTNACALGNRQNDVCLSYSEYIEFNNGTATEYFKDEGAIGDFISCTARGNSTQKDYNCTIDEHYNPNVFKWYNADYDFTDLKFQSGGSQRIRKNNYIRVRLNDSVITTQADIYKLDARFQITGTPTEPLEAYLCNTNYTTGDVVTNSDCSFVASKTQEELIANGLKFRGIFTKNLTQQLNNLGWAVFRSPETSAGNYYSMRTAAIQAAGHTQKWDYSTNKGNSWSNSLDGYESLLNINHFTDGVDPTKIAFKFDFRDNAGNRGNLTEVIYSWTIDADQNFAPIPNIISPQDGSTVNGTIAINWSILDANNDNTLSNITISNSTNTTRLITEAPRDTGSLLLDTTTWGDDTYTITITACENETTTPLCGSDTQTVTFSNDVSDLEALTLPVCPGKSTDEGVIIKPSDIPCVNLFASNQACANTQVSVYNENTFIEQRVLQQYATIYCGATFNQTTAGDYSLNYSTTDNLGNNKQFIKVKAEDDNMASLAITLVLVLINLFFFMSPLFIRFNKNEVWNNIQSKIMIGFGFVLLAFNFGIWTSIADNAGLGITNEMLTYMWFLTKGLYIGGILMFWFTMRQSMELWKKEKINKRMGNE